MVMTQAQPQIDFSALPLDEATVLLQTVGLDVLRRALRGRTERERPYLAHLLPDAQARRLAPRRGFQLTPVGYRPTLARAVGNGLSAQAWRARVWGQLRVRLGRATLGYVPDFLWATVAERAWSTPAFQREATLLARGILQEQYLFPAGSLPTPILASQTFWALLVLAEVRRPPALKRELGALFSRAVLGSPAKTAEHLGKIGRELRAHIPRSWWTWLPTARSRRQRAAAHLRRCAEIEVLAASEWAHFWDQYVMTEAMVHWHGGAPAVRPPVRVALTSLPVANETLRAVFSRRPDARRAQAAAPISTLAHPDWENDRPLWLSSQYDPLELVGG
jgi:hypothetical protein